MPHSFREGYCPYRPGDVIYFFYGQSGGDWVTALVKSVDRSGLYFTIYDDLLKRNVQIQWDPHFSGAMPRELPTDKERNMIEEQCDANGLVPHYKDDPR